MQEDNRKDILSVKDILSSIQNIFSFIEQEDINSFAKSVLIQSAVIRQFEIIGEAATRISDSQKNNFHNIDWRGIKSFRNFLIHEYHRVDIGEVWNTIKNDLPSLNEQMQEILNEISKA